MKKKILALLMTLMMSLGVCSAALAAPQSGVVGFVNLQTIMNSYPGIKDIAKQIADKQAELQKSFNEQSQSMDEKGKAELRGRLNQELQKFENSKMAPVQKNIRRTIDKVAAEQGINSVVNVTAMVTGGKDLTKDVVDALQK